MNFITIFLNVIVIVASNSYEKSSTEKLADLLVRERSENGSYIVVFKDDVTMIDVRRKVAALNTQAKHFYSHTIKGFSAKLDENELMKWRKDARVKYIESDGIVEANALCVLRRPVHHPCISRLSYRERSEEPYRYKPYSGKESLVYVIDTGILINHTEFYYPHGEHDGKLRASWGADFTGRGLNDENGHGTGVGSCVCGRNIGVGHYIKVVAVRVLNENGFGLNSWVIAGIDWAVQQGMKSKSQCRRIINMSLGGGYNRAVNDAVNSAFDNGFAVFVAAGNSNDDCALYSPASAKHAFTVGASDDLDEITYFSNYGTCVDIFAPGNDCPVAWNDGVYRIASGTSFSSPYVAGIAATICAAKSHIILKPQDLYDEITTISTKNVIALSKAAAEAKTTRNLAFTGCFDLHGDRFE